MSRLHDFPEQTLRESEDALIQDALDILESRLRLPGTYMSDPERIATYLKLQLAGRQHEVFGMISLDARGCFLQNHELFRGTLSQCAMYPREVIKEALSVNACSVVIYHNHPSGECTPSREDHTLTAAVRKALEVIDVKVHDHIIVARLSTYSFHEHGHL